MYTVHLNLDLGGINIDIWTCDVLEIVYVLPFFAILG